MIPKRRSSLSDLQMAFSFDVPAPARDAGDLAGFTAKLAASVARMLREDPRERREIARAVSGLLSEDVSKPMLDAYASEGRGDHNISAARWWALVAATGRFDVADAIAKDTGARLLSGDEIKVAELGHLQSERDAIDARIKQLRSDTKPVTRRRR